VTKSTHNRHLKGAIPRAASPRREVKDDGFLLEEDLERGRDRAPALEQIDRSMQVDLVRGSEDGRGFHVVPGTPERLETPELDELDLWLDGRGEVCGRHGVWGDGVLRVAGLTESNAFVSRCIRHTWASGCPLSRGYACLVCADSVNVS